MNTVKDYRSALWLYPWTGCYNGRAATMNTIASGSLMRWIALAFQHAFLRGRAPAVTFPPRLLPLATAVPAPSNSGLCSVLPGCSASPVDVQGSPISPPLPSIETVLRVRVPTLRHVPKASRDAWAGVVGDICQTIVSDPTDLHSLASLLNDCSIPPESRCTLLVDFSNASIPLTVGSCLRRQGPGFLPCPHGWNVAMVPSLCSFWGNILSSAAVVSNKVILWVPWVLL